MFYFLDFEAQMADMFFVSVTPFIFSFSYVSRAIKDNRWTIYLSFLMIFVNFVWFLAIVDRTLILSSAYYVFNFLLLIFIYSVRIEQKSRFDKSIPRFIVAFFVIQIFLANSDLFSLPGEFRDVGTFSNPNQMAYWTLCLLSCVLMLRRDEVGLPVMALLSGGYLIVITLSRGALLGLVALVALFAFHHIRSAIARILGVMIGVATILIVSSAPAFEEVRYRYDLAERLEQRATNRSAADELDIRNYGRILNNPQYIPLGAGEGAYWRFKGESYKEGPFWNIEIHSTILTILFSYGILGISFFLLALYNFWKRAPYETVCLAGVLIYGLSHNGLRFSLFWLLVAILVAETRSEKATPAIRGARQASTLQGTGRLAHRDGRQ